MNSVYNYIYNVADNDTDEILNNKSLGSWKFFEDIIGINYSKIYSRWQSAPELFIPIHLEPNNIPPIEELYNQAVRCYIFGLTEASVAMCRALMEHILKKYYLNYSLRKRISLEDVISLAEKKFEYLKKFKLKYKKNLANKVLHVYENREKMKEKAALDFLKTIRQLVLDIKEKSMM